MKSFLYLIGGLGIATAYMLMKQREKTTPQPVEDLAHKLQDAWADHHTVA